MTEYWTQKYYACGKCGKAFTDKYEAFQHFVCCVGTIPDLLLEITEYETICGKCGRTFFEYTFGAPSLLIKCPFCGAINLRVIER